MAFEIYLVVGLLGVLFLAMSLPGTIPRQNRIIAVPLLLVPHPGASI